MGYGLEEWLSYSCYGKFDFFKEQYLMCEYRFLIYPELLFDRPYFDRLADYSVGINALLFGLAELKRKVPVKQLLNRYYFGKLIIYPNEQERFFERIRKEIRFPTLKKVEIVGVDIGSVSPEKLAHSIMRHSGKNNFP